MTCWQGHARRSPSTRLVNQTNPDFVVWFLPLIKSLSYPWPCLYKCKYSRTHTRTHARTHTHTHTHTHARTHARTQPRTYTHVQPRACARANTDTRTHARTHSMRFAVRHKSNFIWTLHSLRRTSPHYAVNLSISYMKHYNKNVKGQFLWELQWWVARAG